MESVENLKEKIASLQKKVDELELKQNPLRFSKAPLSSEEIERYGRQMINKKLGPEGQVKIVNTKVCIIGLGGLGCPAAMYLAGCGIGTLGLVDFDEVDVSNLHRQVLHPIAHVGMNKALSASSYIRKLNNLIKVKVYPIGLNKENAQTIIKDYDIVLDCTDNVRVRYLINDACILLKKPLVSAACVGLSGQMSVYNHNGGPCYRCVNPVCPESINTCRNAGVLGAVPGIFGSLQAVEALKIASNLGTTLENRMLLFEAEELEFRTIKLRGKQKDCPCSNPEMLKDFDYNKFCGSHVNLCAVSAYSDKLAKAQNRAGVKHMYMTDFAEFVNNPNNVFGETYITIDVRNAVQRKIVHLANSKSYPLGDMRKEKDVVLANVKKMVPDPKKLTHVFTLCRRGIASQSAQLLLSELEDQQKVLGKDVQILNLYGGLLKFKSDIEESVPRY